MSDNAGLVDFVIGLVNSVLNLPDCKLGNSRYRRTVINPAHPKFFFKLIKVTLG